MGNGSTAAAPDETQKPPTKLDHVEKPDPKPIAGPAISQSTLGNQTLSAVRDSGKIDDATKKSTTAVVGTGFALLDGQTPVTNEKIAAVTPGPQSPQTELAALQGQQDKGKGQFKSSLNNEGMFGEAFDWMKSHVGLSPEGRSKYSPLGWYSNVLDYDTSSAAVQKKLTNTDSVLAAATQAANQGNVADFQKDIASITSANPKGGLDINSTAAVSSFAQSESTGREVVEDSLVVSASLYASKKLGPLGGVVTGAVLKPLVHEIDGQGWSTKDIATGALLGASGPAGRAIGGATAKLVNAAGPLAKPVLDGVTSWISDNASAAVGHAATWANNAITTAGGAISRQLGYTADMTVASGDIGGTATFSEMKDQGATTRQALDAAGSAAVTSGEAGALLAQVAFPLQGFAAYRAMPKPVTPAEGALSRPIFEQDPKGLSGEILAAYDKAQERNETFDITVTSPTKLKDGLNEMLAKRGVAPIQSLRLPTPTGIEGILDGGEYVDHSMSVSLSNLTRENVVMRVGHEFTHHQQNLLTLGQSADTAEAAAAIKANQASLTPDAARGYYRFQASQPNVRFTATEAKVAQETQLSADKYIRGNEPMLDRIVGYYLNRNELEARRAANSLHHHRSV